MMDAPGAPQAIHSRDNPLLVKLRRLAQDGAAYRKLGQVWLEGEHLCSALVARGGRAAIAVVSEAAWIQPALRRLAGSAAKTVAVPPELFAGFSALESPAAIGFVLDLPDPPTLDATANTVVLDRVQDAGNVGSILRSAAAFGITQVIALKGTAALWSPKVLRAGMGAHFALRLIDAAEPSLLDALAVPLLATSSRDGTRLHDAALPSPCAWVFSHEGQGVDAALRARCALAVRIPQPGGEESLNVAAAAAVCLYESTRQRAGPRAQPQ
jgi:RNA methyltransferase, TrmH family